MASATAGDCSTAKPSAGAMNGAVHGVATTVASTPVKNEPFSPLPEASRWPTPAIRPGTSNRPARLSPTVNSSSASRVTTVGICN